MKLTIEIAYNCCVKNPDGIEKVYEVMERHRTALIANGVQVYYGSPEWKPYSNPYEEDCEESTHWNSKLKEWDDDYKIFTIINFFKAIDFEATEELKNKIKLFIKDCETRMDKLGFKYEFIGGYLSEKFKKSANGLQFITLLDDDYDSDNEYMENWSIREEQNKNY